MNVDVCSVADAGVEIVVAYPELAANDPFAAEAGYLANGIDITPLAGSELAQSAARHGGWSFVALVDGEVAGGVTVVPDEIVSEHFGVRCASISWYCRGVEQRMPIVGALVEAVVSRLRDEGFEHASIRVSVDDFDAMYALQSRRFFVADTMISFLVRTVSEDRELIYEDQYGDLRLCALFGDDLKALEPAVPELFAGLIEEHYGLSRFHADPHFNSMLAGAWYGEWCRRAFAGEWADGAILARHEGDPMGFICWKRDDAKSELLDCEFFGSGLGASGGHSAYSVMLGAAVESSFFRWAVFDLHIANSPVVRAVSRNPQSRQIRVAHTLHIWLGED